MDNRSRFATIVACIACLVLVIASLLDQSQIAAVAKILASCGFIAVAIFCGAMRSAYGKSLLAGLALSFVGDVSLIGETREAFLTGLGAFLLAHIAYVSAFAIRGVDARAMLIAGVPVALIATAVSAWLLPYIAADMRVPVFAYTFVISVMLVAAFGTRGKGATVLILVGAVLFFLSDLSVALQRLVQSDFPTYIWGLPLYYAGQLCLAVSVSRSVNHNHDPTVASR